MSKKIEKLNTKAVSNSPPAEKKKDGRAKNGGPRPNSGPKVTAEKKVVIELKELIENHGKEEVEIKTTKGEIIKKSRILLLLDKLFLEGLNKGNIPAAKEYLDRAMGKAVQPIKGPGDNGEFFVKTITYGSGDYSITK